MWTALLLAAQQGAASGATEAVFERVKPSVFTIEVHSGNVEAKSTLGSGYLVSSRGELITNYHVVSSYIEEPERYRIRARNQTGQYEARLAAFDLVNDLAVLKVDGATAPPLVRAARPPATGASIVAFGNPQGLGLSLIEGIFNGFAEKGVVDRMLLSMPLNSGMSGGPILNAAGEVIGTNVSVIWLSNSLSFGVPGSKIEPLLAAGPVTLSKDALRQEVLRQLLEVEQTTVARAIAPFADRSRTETITVGGADALAPPSVYECWDDTQVFRDEGITKARHGCNLQFTPSVASLGEVASVDLLVEHFDSRDSRYGFYATLSDHPASHHDVMPVDPEGGVTSAPVCRSDRIWAGTLAWQVSTCVNAYVRYPGLFNINLAATSVSRPDEAAFVAVHLKGFRTRSFETLARAVLAGVHLRGGRP